MNRKIIVGIIIVSVGLILISLVSVVAYQTTKSNLMKASPLFNMRTKRAIDEKHNDEGLK